MQGTRADLPLEVRWMLSATRYVPGCGLALNQVGACDAIGNKAT